MKQQIIAKAYAKSIIELGEETKVDVTKDLVALTETINKSNDLENLMFTDVFTAEEKWNVLDAILTKLSSSQLTRNLIQFLIAEKRLGLLPLIFKDVVVIDDHKKGFLRGTIEGNEDQVPESMKNQLKEYLKNKLGKEAILSYTKNNQISAGFRVTVEDLQLDATLENQLEKFKENVLNS
jgi:F-type H+-transporting ATPase subunit delta